MKKWDLIVESIVQTHIQLLVVEALLNPRRCGRQWSALGTLSVKRQNYIHASRSVKKHIHENSDSFSHHFKLEIPFLLLYVLSQALELLDSIFVEYGRLYVLC